MSPCVLHNAIDAFNQASTTRESGFTLIEVLVALVISLLGALGIMQIYVGSEAGKRATGSLAEAQSGGIVAIYGIEREIQKAGMGMMHAAALGCVIRTNLGSGFDNIPLQPVTIIPAGASATHASNLWGVPPGDANSDMLAIATGSASTMVEGTILKIASAPAATTYRLSNTAGIVTGDYLLITEKNKACTLTTVAATPTSNGEVTVTHGGAEAYSLSAAVLHLGRSPEFAVYAVRNGALTRCDFFLDDCADTSKKDDTKVWVPVANDVVALIAQYGVDTTTPFEPDSKTVDAFCKSRLVPGETCSGSDTGYTSPGAISTDHAQRACDWARIPIVQVALVTRSGQAEKEEVSPASLKLWPDVTAVPPITTGPVWSVPDRHYRYRVTRSATAMRNVVWMKSGTAPSC
jgi:type IV pilus assembly protein PilW